MPCRYLAFHARGGNHCHLNFIGVSKSNAAKAKQAFQASAKRAHFAFDSLAGKTPAERQQALQGAVGQSQYFQVFLPGGERLVHPIPRCAGLLSVPAGTVVGHVKCLHICLVSVCCTAHVLNVGCNAGLATLLSCKLTVCKLASPPDLHGAGTRSTQ